MWRWAGTRAASHFKLPCAGSICVAAVARRYSGDNGIASCRRDYGTVEALVKVKRGQAHWLSTPLVCGMAGKCGRSVD
jgi:hypothetical protein